MHHIHTSASGPSGIYSLRNVRNENMSKGNYHLEIDKFCRSSNIPLKTAGRSPPGSTVQYMSTGLNKTNKNHGMCRTMSFNWAFLQDYQPECTKALSIWSNSRLVTIQTNSLNILNAFFFIKALYNSYPLDVRKPLLSSSRSVIMSPNCAPIEGIVLANILSKTKCSTQFREKPTSLKLFSNFFTLYRNHVCSSLHSRRRPTRQMSLQFYLGKKAR